jgi:hypothetical protein
MKNKKAIEMSFAWIFAILAGAFILFGAIYGTIKLINSGQSTSNVVCAKDLSILYEPMETGLASGKVAPVSLVTETRIYNRCYSDSAFGRQEFSCSQKSGMLKEWPGQGNAISLNNKYVFSEKMEQGRNFKFFSKPFEMPFKVSEMIFILNADKTYCFDSAPDFIKQDISDLKIQGILKTDNCTGKEARVCFNSNGAGCNVSIFPLCSGIECENEFDYGYTRKDGKMVYYSGSLIYASILSDPDIYQCNFVRLMKRVQQIAYLYNDEQTFLATRGCGTAMSSSLSSLAQAASSADGASEASLVNLLDAAGNAESQNSAQGGCKIWG